MRRRAVLITVAACASMLAAAALLLTNHSKPPGAGRYEHLSLNAGSTSYRYVVYLPPGYSAASAAPLVVVLHGCNTSADQQTVASGYDAIARLRRFVVLYPEVDAADRAHGHCWKGIWDSAAESRSRGDAGAIADMTRAVMARWPIDRTRVYVIGISAGAFETSILAANYPDLYAAVGIHSGAAYRGGQPGCVPTDQVPAGTDTLARAALTAMGPRARVMPVIVFHGDQDNTIPYPCGQQAVDQWLRTDDLTLQPTRPPLPATPTVAQHVVPGGHAYTVASYGDTVGCPVAQLWTIHGMGHFWSGGSSNRSVVLYSDPRGPSAAAASWDFFSHWRLAGPVATCVRGGYAER